MRIHEKAMDDYLEDFDDFHDDKVVPEACVNDVIRCRVIGMTDKDMLELQRRLGGSGQIADIPSIRAKPAEGSHGPCVEIDAEDGTQVSITLLRAKNKFHRKALSPTHFRCILNNLLFEHAGRKVCARRSRATRD